MTEEMSIIYKPPLQSHEHNRTVSYIDDRGITQTLKLINLVEESDGWTMYMIWRPEK
jgi:hypothetical protein